ncbi:MAG: hypothetical protein R3E77_01345 [Steroidobacteraceae bacterium]
MTSGYERGGANGYAAFNWARAGALLVLGLGLAQVSVSDTATPAMRLQVDATDIDHRIYRVHETLAVTPGPITLYYPQWLPGNHAPTGPIDALAGLQIEAGGERIAWQRDAGDMYAFHVIVPDGAKQLDIDLQFVSPFDRAQGRIVMTREILSVQWEKMLLYPASVLPRELTVAASIRLPDGWQYATALGSGAGVDGQVEFAPTSLATLIDSPLFAGAHFRSLELTGNSPPARLNVLAQNPRELNIADGQVGAHAELMRQARELFGGQHYHHYDFLLALSDEFSGIGLEHHQSSENAVAPGYFINWNEQRISRDLLPHELVHSWNGKYRRPADLTTDNYNQPMGNTLLWVYEGLTEYWGFVLAARSQLWDRDFARESLAWVAAVYGADRQGRSWRPLADTVYQPIMSYGGAVSYPDWQRRSDYYSEGQLLWLGIDARLRELTSDRRSLDDFARRFFGGDSVDLAPSTYEFADVVAALEAIAPGDWANYLGERLHTNSADRVLEALSRSGWQLSYTAALSPYIAERENERKIVDLYHSIGVVLSTKNAEVQEVRWGSAAFEAGLAPGMTVIAVDERSYTPQLLKAAVAAAQSDGAVITLLVRVQDRYRSVAIKYSDGARYPHLVPLPGAKDRLAAILKPRATRERSGR